MAPNKAIRKPESRNPANAAPPAGPAGAGVTAVLEGAGVTESDCNPVAQRGFPQAFSRQLSAISSSKTYLNAGDQRGTTDKN